MLEIFHTGRVAANVMRLCGPVHHALTIFCRNLFFAILPLSKKLGVSGPVCCPSASQPPSISLAIGPQFAFKMSIICQDVAILTTTTVRTILTVYVSTVLSQAVGRPTPLTSVIVGSSCSAYTSANLTTERCSTSSSTATMYMSAG